MDESEIKYAGLVVLVMLTGALLIVLGACVYAYDWVRYPVRVALAHLTGTPQPPIPQFLSVL